MLPSGDIVFDHETRKMVYNHILTYPGVSYNILQNIFGLSSGTLRYHLEYLEKAERILSCIETGKRCYYPIQNDIVVSELFKNKPQSYKFTLIQQQILSTIKRAPGINQKDLIKRTGLSRYTISYNLNKFINMGFVKKSNNANNVCYEYMTDELLRHEVLLRLTMKLLNKEISEATFLELKDKLINK
jgi:predicted transcriptional regulator